MRLRNLLAQSGPWPMAVEPNDIARRIEERWRGTLTFMTIPAAKRRWRTGSRAPSGAAEHLARDIESAVLDAGATDAHVERVLLACMSSHLYV